MATLTLYMRNEQSGSDYLLGTSNTSSSTNTLGSGNYLYFKFFRIG